MTNDQSATPSLLADTALNDPALDRLDRAQFAESLSRSILTLGGDDSLAIGLCGPWGSGKTTVLNFVVSDLEAAGEQTPILLKFNPWWFSGRQQLLEAFFAQFTAVLKAPKRGEKAKKAAKLLETLSAGLRPLALLPLIGEAAKAGRDAVDALAGAANAYADAVQLDVVAVRAQIDELLKDFTQRVVVVMDDIDRLAAPEIAQLFLILKAVADFPRTVYLLAFDHTVVTQAIKEQLGVEGKAYLEKIIQLQIDVPPTAQTALHHMFLEQLNEIIEKDELSQEQVQDFWNMFHDGIKHLLITPRAVKKLINMLRFAYPPLRGEVNVVDMVGVCCLSTFVPHLIPTMAMNAEQFVGTGTSSSAGFHDDRKDRDKFHRTWLDKVAASEKDPVEAIVRRLFPAVDHVFGGPGYSDGFSTMWRQQLRVCSEYHFEKYFRLAIPSGTISESDWKVIVSQFDNQDALDHAITSFTNMRGRHGVRSRANEFLDRALLFAKNADEQAARSLFTSLMRVGDLLCQVKDEQTLGGVFPIDNTLRLTWVLHQLLGRIAENGDRESLVTESLSQSVGLFVGTELVVSLGYQNGAYGNRKENDDPRFSPIVTKAFISRIATQMRFILQTASLDNTGGTLSSRPDVMKIVVNWWRIGGKREAREFLRSVTAEDRMLVSVIAQQITKSSSHGERDRVAIETEVLDAKWLSNFLPLKGTRKRCESILAECPEWLDERGKSAIQIAIKSITPAGAPIDHWEKRRRDRLKKQDNRRKKSEKGDDDLTVKGRAGSRQPMLSDVADAPQNETRSSPTEST
jgi:predicted KAP-like P-loop ATPase